MSGEGRYERDRFHSRSRSRSPFRKNFNERPYHEENFKGRRNRSPETRKPRGSTANNRVFVTNIPFECRWMDIKDLFREKVGDVAFVELFEDDNGKFKGCGVVEFKDAETAKKAVEIMHKQECQGRMLNVKLDTGEFERRRTSSRVSERDFQYPNDGFGNNDMRPDPPFNTYGLNPQFLKSIGISGPLNNKIFVSNLDYKVNDDKLKEIFKIAGKLVKVEVNLDSEGKSKGHGVVEFEHPLEAVQAISMFNGQRLFARIMNVRMDKFTDDSDSLPPKLPSGLHGMGKGLGINGQPMQFNKTSSGTTPVGNFGFGMGLGNGMSGGIGSSNMLSSSNMNNSMADRMMGSSMGIGMAGSNMNLPSPLGMGMGGRSSMMASGNMMGHSASDNMGFDSYQGDSGMSKGYRDGFDRPSDYGSSNITDTVIVGNLPNSFSWQTLKNRFREIGEIRYADAKGPGTVLIRFASVADAQRAVDMMHGFRIEGRPMEVRFY